MFKTKQLFLLMKTGCSDLTHNVRNPPTMSDSPTLSITLLGAGQEVGRSCCVLKYRGKTVVCDAGAYISTSSPYECNFTPGVHPAHNGMASLPFVDELDWSTVDAILVTQYDDLSLIFFLPLRSYATAFTLIMPLLSLISWKRQAPHIAPTV